MRFKVAIAAALLVVCVSGILPAASCDGQIALEGVAHELIDAPSFFKGIIYINEEVDLTDENLQPLKGVRFSNTYAGSPVISDNSGRFTFVSTGAPGKYTIEVTAEKEGYYMIESKPAVISGVSRRERLRLMPELKFPRGVNYGSC